MGNEITTNGAKVTISWKWLAVVSLTVLVGLVGGWGAEQMRRASITETRLDSHAQRLDLLEQRAAVVQSKLEAADIKLNRIEDRQGEVLRQLAAIDVRLGKH